LGLLIRSDAIGDDALAEVVVRLGRWVFLGETSIVPGFWRVSRFAPE
jgi:hypothetical protein